MYKHFLFLLSILGTITFCACDKDDLDDPVIDYYFTISKSEQYQSAKLAFDYARAIQDYPEDNTTGARTIYIDSATLSFDADSPESVYLGQSEIETRLIKKFNVNVNSLQVSQGQLPFTQIPLNWLSSTDAIGEEFQPNRGELVKVTFELQLDESIVLQDDGSLKFEPVIITIIERN